jgi:hypothetical protein
MHNYSNTELKFKIISIYVYADIRIMDISTFEFPNTNRKLSDMFFHPIHVMVKTLLGQIQR